MGLFDQLSGILQQHETSGGSPTNLLADGLAHAMRSNQTPAFGQIIGTLFSQANVTQKQGMVNHLLAALGQGAASPQQVQAMPPQVVQQLAEQAHGSNQDVVNMVSGFCAQHPDLIKGLDTGTLGQIMSHISQQTRT